jgi:hypothetical protein
MNHSAAASGTVNAIDHSSAGRNARPENPQSPDLRLCAMHSAMMITTGSTSHGPGASTSGSATHM